MNADEAWKAGAERYAQYYGDVRRILSTEFAAEIRWLTASLFALNSGGLFSLSSKNYIDSREFYAGLVFWVGILLAFGFVTYSQRKSQNFLSVIQEIENCWVVTAATGVPGGNRLQKLEDAKNKISSKFSILFSIGSFSMFTAGLGLLAWSQ